VGDTKSHEFFFDGKEIQPQGAKYPSPPHPGQYGNIKFSEKWARGKRKRETSAGQLAGKPAAIKFENELKNYRQPTHQIRSLAKQPI